MNGANAAEMIPVGYMYKFVAAPPGCVTARNVVDVYSVGGCGGSTTRYFDDNYINYWKHNGYWFFNSPEVMEEIAQDNSIDLSKMTLFYYEVYAYEFDQSESGSGTGHVQESHFDCCPDFPTDVAMPKEKTLVGYDVTEFVCRNAPECSLLTCCDLTSELSVNSHCLFDTFEQAEKAVKSGIFHACEPGPYRIFAVYLVQ